MAFKELPKHMLDGPIPGENYTSDTKNYAWHRPPEFTEPDQAIEYLSGVMLDEDGSSALLSMVEAGIDLLSIAQIIILKAVSAGKFSIDLGLLLAGPIVHILILMARGYEVEYEVGFTPPRPMPGKSFFNEIRKIDKEKAKKAAEGAAEGAEVIQEMASGGFLALDASEEIQEASGEDTPEVPEEEGFI